MKRRQPTEAQKLAAAERRQKMRTLARRLGELTPEDREAIAARAGIRTIEGRPLSVFNQCMLISQAPDATVVGGFQQWRKAGRIVAKGSRGLAIWIPVAGAAETEEPGEAAIGGEEGMGRRRRFVLGTVFDITQTQDARETIDQAEPAALPVVVCEAPRFALAG